MVWPYVMVETSCPSILTSPLKTKKFYGHPNYRAPILILEQGYSSFRGRLVIGNNLKAYQEAFGFRKIIFTMAVVKQKRVVPTEV